MQNRLAQRNFRDKRQQKLSETLQQLERNKQDHREEVSDLTRKHSEEKLALQQQLKQSQARVKQLQEDVKRLGKSSTSPFWYTIGYKILI
jgi:F0F1-type ATP synthase membrane subunit b/b'